MTKLIGSRFKILQNYLSSELEMFLWVVNTYLTERNCTPIKKIRVKDGGMDKIYGLVHLYKCCHKYIYTGKCSVRQEAWAGWWENCQVRFLGGKNTATYFLLPDQSVKRGEKVVKLAALVGSHLAKYPLDSYSAKMWVRRRHVQPVK